MWKPCLPGVMPEIFHAMTHGASALACENVTMPVHGVAPSAPPWHGLPAGDTAQVAWIGNVFLGGWTGGQIMMEVCGGKRWANPICL